MMRIDNEKDVLILEASRMLPVAIRREVEKRVEEKTERACVMLDRE